MNLLRRLSRLVVLGLVLASLAVGGVAVAAQATPPGQAKKASTSTTASTTSTTGPGNSGPVKPGKGCGDKNHYHERENECKKTPK